MHLNHYGISKTILLSKSMDDSMGSQSLRLSEYILTYGPGSIMESAMGPRIILRPDLGLFEHGSPYKPEKFAINDDKMSNSMLNGARVFRLPSDSEVEPRPVGFIYKTKRFPEWSVCLNSRYHGSDFYVLHNYSYCPVCNNPRSTPNRFIRACSGGHMDDVEWQYVVHGEKHCSPKYLRWHGGGGSLSKIHIECPKCLKRVSLGDAYAQRWRCSGRFPESNVIQQCDKKAQIIQRQASNLRIAELVTLFTIPPIETELQLYLRNPTLASVFELCEGDIEKYLKDLEKLVEKGRIHQNVFDEVKNNKESIVELFDEIRKEGSSKTYYDLLLEEYHALVEASKRGAPMRRLNSRPVFEVDPNDIKKFEFGKNSLRVVPVSKLRTVTVLKGYRRYVGLESESPEPPDLIDVSFAEQHNPSSVWYPGMELYGEGIFILLDDEKRFKISDTCGWDQVTQKDYLDRKGAMKSTGLFRNPEKAEELNPLFVWWHTLSHLIIRGLSNESGYSAASIRERVYLDVEHSQGGILLYTTQPGSDGTLGGMIGLVPSFGEIIERSLTTLHTCSSDPLCIQNGFKRGKHSGSACHGCLLLSETSCEHRNMWLDRKIVKGNML